MQPQQDPRARGEVLDPTEARQANPRKMNFRVLLVSMALSVVAGVILVAGFWHETPPRVDASSGGNPSQNTQQSGDPSAGAPPQPSQHSTPSANP
jgi:hypothetical protein